MNSCFDVQYFGLKTFRVVVIFISYPFYILLAPRSQKVKVLMSANRYINFFNHFGIQKIHKILLYSLIRKLKYLRILVESISLSITKKRIFSLKDH